MPTTFLLTLAPVLLSAALSAWLSWNAWRRRHAAGATALTVITAAVALWSFCYALELAAVSLEAKLFWARFQYLGIVALPVAWLIVAVQYRQERKGIPSAYWLLGIVPAITVLLVVTNQAHGLIWSETTLSADGAVRVLQVRYGPWFWVHAAYSYLLLLLGSGVIISALLRRPHTHRWRGAALLLAVLAPWAGNMLHLSGYDPIPPLDSTPLALTLTGVLLTLGLFSFGQFELLPVARAAVMEAMQDGVIVLTHEGRISEINPTAAAQLGLAPNAVIGRTAAALPVALWPLARLQPDHAAGNHEIHLPDAAGGKFVEVRVSPVLDRGGIPRGRLLVLRDITEARRAELTRQKLAALVEHSNDFIGMADIDGRVTFVNRSGRTLVGLDGDSPITGRPMDEFIDPQDWRRFRSEVVPQVLQQGAWHGELSFAHFAGGAPIPMQCEIFLVRDPQTGSAISFATVSRDHSEAKRLARLRDDLTHTMVHDLRNPLTAVQGALDIVRLQSPLEPLARDLVEIAAKGSRQMLRLVNAILDVTRLESSQMPLVPEAVHLAALAEEVVQLLAPLTTRKALSVCILSHEAPLVAWVDRGLVGRVLQNLLGNAITYTPESGTIVVSVALLQERPDTLVVRVRDSGPGVPDEIQTRLFDKFVTGPNREGGSGLGLAFCRLAVEAHGGRIWLEQQPDQGAVFCFTLPQAAFLPLEASQPPERRAEALRQGRCVPEP